MDGWIIVIAYDATSHINKSVRTEHPKCLVLCISLCSADKGEGAMSTVRRCICARMLFFKAEQPAAVPWTPDVDSRDVLKGDKLQETELSCRGTTQDAPSAA